MTRQEAQERLQKAKQRIQEADLEIKEVEQYLKTHPEREIIRVPDNIKIEKGVGGGDRLGIRFTDHVLNWMGNTWAANSRINGRCDYDLIPCELIPVKKEDLKIGYKYHCTNSPDLAFAADLYFYGIYDGSGFICIDDEFPVKTEDDLRYYYQVVPIKEQS